MDIKEVNQKLKVMTIPKKIRTTPTKIKTLNKEG
jgi:hypothetical protein